MKISTVAAAAVVFTMSAVDGAIVGGLAEYQALIADLVQNNTFGALIVGGSEAPMYKYTFNAGMRSSAAGSSFCGGSLIAPGVVLTAAHCLDIPWVSAATHYRSGASDGAQRSVQRAVRHPDYNAHNNDYDFALLFLSSNVGVRAVALASNSGGDEGVGRTATVTGWGGTQEGGQASDVLLEVDVDIVSNAQCNSALQQVGFGGITNRMICAGGIAGQDACHGDSGGPLFVNKDGVPILVGDVSWGIGCARAGLPGVYGRISSVRSWIDSNIRTFSANDAEVNWVRV